MITEKNLLELGFVEFQENTGFFVLDNLWDTGNANTRLLVTTSGTVALEQYNHNSNEEAENCILFPYCENFESLKKIIDFLKTMYFDTTGIQRGINGNFLQKGFRAINI